MTDERLVSILVPAVGGQGGGVLAEWIVDAAMLEGHRAHATSIPGVAQRTGSTTYYVEIFVGDPGGDEPVFSLYPVPGAVDVLLAPEFLEVGRAIEQGMASPQRTTIVASTHRLFSIHEKTATGRAIHPVAELEAAARAFSRRFVGLDALAVAREHDSEANAVLLGALAGSGAVPIGVDAFRSAVQRKRIQVDANLRGFDVGVALGRQGAAPSATLTLPAQRRLPARFADAVTAFPASTRAIVAEALARLVDYQDERYAGLYLERLASFVGERPDPELIGLIARHLALWMTYEDAVRVAELEDPSQSARADPARRAGRRRRDPRDRLSQAGSRRAVRHPAVPLGEPSGAVGRAAMAARPPDRRPAGPDDDRARIPAPLAAGAAAPVPPGVVPVPARARADGALADRHPSVRSLGCRVGA